MKGFHIRILGFDTRDQILFGFQGRDRKRQGRIPRYAEFLNVDANGDYAYREGYHKLLVDFKMFDKEGNILPQGNIAPNLDEGFMKDLLNAEIDRKQNYEFPQKVYDAIDKKFGEKYSSQETDFDKEFNYSELNWARDLGIINTKDITIFERTINNEILRGAKPQSANGEYIIDTGKCLMFTDGDFHNPTLSRVIVFATEYESLLDEAKRRILYEARSTGDVQESKQVIEDLYGPGFAVEYTQTVYGTNAWQNRGRKRENGKGSDRSYRAKSLKERFAEEGLAHLLEDEGDVYSSQETDRDNESKAHPYSYTTMVSKPGMVITEVDGNVPANRADVVYAAKQNAAKVGRLNPNAGSVSVLVDDVEKKYGTGEGYVYTLALVDNKKQGIDGWRKLCDPPLHRDS